MKNGLLITCLGIVVGGGVVIAKSQDPQFNTQGLEPYLTKTEAPLVEEPTVAPAPSNWVDEAELSFAVESPAPAAPADKRISAKKVTVSFQNAKVDDVTKWLVRQGFNLVIPSDARMSDKRVTLSLKDVPADEALDAIAAALGGRWEQRGSVKVFRSGVMPRIYTTPPVPPVPGRPDVRVFGAPRQLTEKERQELENLGRDMGEMGAKLGEEIMKSFSDGSFKFEFDEKRIEELAKGFEKDAAKWESLAKDLELKMGKEGPEREKAIREFRERMSKEMPKIGELMKELRISGDGQARAFAFPEGRRMTPEERAKFEARLKELPKNMPMIRIGEGGADLAALAKELTPAQRELHRKQGYLKASDLTPAQRKHLGGMTLSGSWTITYSKDGESLTIRSDQAPERSPSAPSAPPAPRNTIRA